MSKKKRKENSTDKGNINKEIDWMKNKNTTDQKVSIVQLFHGERSRTMNVFFRAKRVSSKIHLWLIALISLGIFQPLSAQSYGRIHELFPFVGLYAPDRFQSSLAIGVRYEHHFDQRLSLGATVGFAKAGQDYFHKAVGVAAEQGSATVIFYNGRITHTFPVGGVIPYGVVGLGVTRQHSESNLTISLGIGTKIPIGERTYLRYEFNDHIFTSGQNNTSWTNNNLELAVGISFYLQ